MLKIKQFICI